MGEVVATHAKDSGTVTAAAAGKIVIIAVIL
jgi:hypothetical protein